MFSSARSRLGALRELRGPREVLTFVQIELFAAAVPLVTRMPLPRLAALLGAVPARQRTPSDEQVARLDRMVALAPRVGAPLVRTGCLTRGLTLFWFLRRAGLDVELRFGIDPTPGSEIDGHCWLTLKGEPFLEKRDPRVRFAETYRLPILNT